ncbi:MAG: hypothetical protein GEV07_03760 [Streptosporangiales bacterium]|nr:hypothetical protein [Streptosporangiales bacterium]
MAIRFYGQDPDTDGGHCASVSVDDNGDFLFVAPRVTDEAKLREIIAHSPIADHEAAVRMPARMAHIIAEAMRGGTPVQ